MSDQSKLDPEVASIHRGRADCQPFILSIEPCRGKVFQHGYHLGTIEKIARQFAVEIFKRHTMNGMDLYTVALMRCGKIYDVWDGRDWFNDIAIDEDIDVAGQLAELERAHAS